MEFLECLLTISFIAVAHSQNLNPGQLAPNFTLPTLSGPIIYKGLKSNETNIKPPLIFHEFTNHSGFLECLWTKDASILELIDNSPENTKYIFLTSSNDAESTAIWMRAKFYKALDTYYHLAKNLSTSVTKSEIGRTNRWVDSSLPTENILRDNKKESLSKKSSSFPKPKRRIDRRSLSTDHAPVVRKPRVLTHPSVVQHHKPWHWSAYEKHHGIEVHGSKKKGTVEVIDHEKRDHIVYRYDNKGSRRSAIYRYAQDVEENELEEDVDPSALEGRITAILKKGRQRFIEDWMDRLHFVTLPLYQVGNWIPLVMSRWYCSGHGCGLDQVAVETEKEGDIQFVAKRLDARYDWLPSPYTLKTKKPKSQILDLGNGCTLFQSFRNFTGKTALISREGNCSFFEKMEAAQRAGAIAAVVYTTGSQPLVDMTCEKEECEKELRIPGTMIPYGAGQKIRNRLANLEDVYIRYQHSPSRNFFLAIDEQGKLQEVGWLLYPSMIFLAYQAKWLNYFTNLLHNITSMDAQVVNVFNYTIMHGSRGVVKTIDVPPLQDLQQYKKVYLDMSLSCPGTTDYTCPHWDHTVQLYLCCDKAKPLCKKEIGRWITPFRRRIGRWLTNITPLIPLFTSTKCRFTMKTVPWAMPWKPALKLRLADKIRVNTSVPYKVIPLFRGGKFDRTYNTKRRPLNFTIPPNVSKVKVFATITGHGSDNNNCAEFCVTSHYFVVNEEHKHTRVFDSAGTASGCADQVSEGSEPNEHGTWLYGRDGWCDGEKVSPWVEDITANLNMQPGTLNTIRYYGYFNGTDPKPTANPGYIIMYSYLVFYKDVAPK